MKTAPSISQSEIHQLVNEKYNIQVQNLEFIPRGECSWSYKVSTTDNQHFFLKLIASQDVSSYFEDSLNTLYILKNNCHIHSISSPIKTRDNVCVLTYKNFAISLFEFIHGSAQNQQSFTDKQLFEVGKLLAQLHNSTSQLKNFPCKETFDTDLIPKGELLLKKLEEVKSNNVQSNVSTLLLSVYKELSQAVDEFKAVQQRLKNDSSIENVFVFCHSDPSPGNFIAKNNEIFLVDWDFPILAPKERDLVCITGYAAAMEGYKSVIPETAIHQDSLRFYQLCWTIDLILDHVPKDFDFTQDISQEDLAHLKKNLVEYGLISPQTTP